MIESRGVSFENVIGELTVSFVRFGAHLTRTNEAFSNVPLRCNVCPTGGEDVLSPITTGIGEKTSPFDEYFDRLRTVWGWGGGKGVTINQVPGGARAPAAAAWAGYGIRAQYRPGMSARNSRNGASPPRKPVRGNAQAHLSETPSRFMPARIPPPSRIFYTYGARCLCACILNARNPTPTLV